jgi:hypothetical protein
MNGEKKGGKGDRYNKILNDWVGDDYFIIDLLMYFLYNLLL